MMRYWKKLRRGQAGHYYAKSDYDDRTLHIYRIKRGLWGFSYDRGPRMGIFNTLAEAKIFFGLY